jgi:hypothetical protein
METSEITKRRCRRSATETLRAVRLAQSSATLAFARRYGCNKRLPAIWMVNCGQLKFCAEPLCGAACQIIKSNNQTEPCLENKRPYRTGLVCRSHGSGRCDRNLGWYSLRARESLVFLAGLKCPLLAHSGHELVQCKSPLLTLSGHH